MADSGAYRIVKLASGAHSVHSLAHAETFHPVIGPVAEAEALYVNQLNLLNRLEQHSGEFVVWDVGLGAAANAITILQATGDRQSTIRFLSFDHTIEPLSFALRNTQHLDYLAGYELTLEALLQKRKVSYKKGPQTVFWEFYQGDFPTLLTQPLAKTWARPHVIMFDAFSPAKNPAMWSLPLFTNLYQLLDPQRPCALPTYSRSTILRVTLLLAGFYVGKGHATGEKEETTIAANSPQLIAEPLNRRWLERAHRSSSAEPLRDPIYRQAPLSNQTWEKLREHPQFKLG